MARPVALFVVGGEQFAFVPGGQVTVGFDGHRFEPTAQQQASFADSADEHGIDADIWRFTDSVTSSLRTVVLPPLLVAVDAVESGAAAVPRCRRSIRKLCDASTGSGAGPDRRRNPHRGRSSGRMPPG